MRLRKIEEEWKGGGRIVRKRKIVSMMEGREG